MTSQTFDGGEDSAALCSCREHKCSANEYRLKQNHPGTMFPGWPGRRLLAESAQPTPVYHRAPVEWNPDSAASTTSAGSARRTGCGTAEQENKPIKHCKENSITNQTKPSKLLQNLTSSLFLLRAPPRFDSSYRKLTSLSSALKPHGSQEDKTNAGFLRVQLTHNKLGSLLLSPTRS